MKNILSNDILR